MNQPAAPAWTLKGKRCTIDELNGGHVDSSPGPVYNLSGMGHKTYDLAFTTGKSNRTDINHGVLNNPSPAQYTPNNPNLVTYSVTFPKDGKNTADPEEGNPDPAAYQFNPNITRQAYPKYSMGSKYTSIMDSTGNNPGPGFYNNPELLLASQMTRNSKFGTQGRFSQPSLRLPGPGHYNISTGLVSGKGRLSQSRRSVELKTTPGPGDYKHSDQFQRNASKNVGKTLGKKFDGCFNAQSETTEAFNNYFKGDGRAPGKSFSVGKQNREVFRGNELPGPTDYLPSHSHVFKEGARVGFAQSSWVDHNQLIHNPGPGDYKDQKFRSTRYTIPKSKSLGNLSKTPGAGRYDPEKGMGSKFQKYKNQISGSLIGKSHRTNFVSRNMAGVGDYTLLAKKTAGVTIPKANRFPKPNSNPGPGDYHMSSTISNFNMYRRNA